MQEEWLLSFKDLIAAKTGLRIRSNDNASLTTRIHLRTSQLALNSYRDYYRLIASDTDEGRLELKGFAGLLMVGESYFFRDAGQFKLLREVILPELIERRSKERQLRVWSAGCSTGEEPYSLAILLNELLPDRNGWTISIIGTDVREDFLEKARSGVYGNWSFRQVDESITTRYFRKKSSSLALDERIRGMVNFSEFDLLEGGLPNLTKGLYAFDLIVCRNVFVYYNRQSIQRMVEKMTAVLNDNGYLMTAHGELFSLPLGLLRPKIFDESVLYEKAAVSPKAYVAEQKVITEGFAGAPRRVDAVKKRVDAPAPACIRRGRKSEDGLKELQALFRRGLYSKVIEKAFKALKDRPGDYRMLYLSGAAYANLGEFEKAGERLRAALAADALAAEPYYFLALIAEEQGESEKARDALKKAIYLKKDFIAAYLELASLQEHEGELERPKKLRLAALDEVNRLPADSSVEMYDDTTAGELRSYLQKMVGA